MMNTKLTIYGVKTAVFAALMAGMHSAYADGYRNPPPTAEGIAKSGANSVFVDDASAISYNPANLAFQTNQSLVIGTTFARTETDYSTMIPDFSTLPPTLTPFSATSDGDWNVLPNLYFSMPVGDGIVFGLGITTPYGQGISWDGFEALLPPPVEGMVPYEATAMVVDFTPAVAVKVSDTLSVGVGVDIYYSTLELKAHNGLILPSPPFPPGTHQILEVEGEGSGWGLGGNAALTWMPTEGHRTALTFKSGMKIDYSGDFKASGVNAGNFETTIKYPNSVGLGYGIALNEKIQLEALIEWLQWSVNDSQTLTIGSESETVRNDWDDTFTLGFGGSWLATEDLTVRAGYAYIPTPIPSETITPLLPDADRHALSIGLGYALGAHVIDVAYTFSIYSDRSSPVGSEAPGTYEIDSDLVGLTYSYSF